MTLTAKYEDNVFINCPFDQEYTPIFQAIVFAIHDLGFVARCSLEHIGTEETRLTKILQIIRECKYGIHDLSRIEPNPKGMPRFNMPFECGLFWGCLEFGDGDHKSKRMLVIETEPHDYQSKMSDIAGQDIKFHSNDPESAVQKVRSWLAAASGRKAIPGGKKIWKHYELFKGQLPTMLNVAGITATEIADPDYYNNYVNLVVEYLQILQSN